MHTEHFDSSYDLDDLLSVTGTYRPLNQTTIWAKGHEPPPPPDRGLETLRDHSRAMTVSGLLSLRGSGFVRYEKRIPSLNLLLNSRLAESLFIVFVSDDNTGEWLEFRYLGFDTLIDSEVLRDARLRAGERWCTPPSFGKNVSITSTEGTYILRITEKGKRLSDLVRSKSVKPITFPIKRRDFDEFAAQVRDCQIDEFLHNETQKGEPRIKLLSVRFGTLAEGAEITSTFPRPDSDLTIKQIERGRRVADGGTRGRLSQEARKKAKRDAARKELMRRWSQHKNRDKTAILTAMSKEVHNPNYKHTQEKPKYVWGGLTALKGYCADIDLALEGKRLSACQNLQAEN